MSGHPRAPASGSTRIVWLFIGTFALTIASFVAAVTVAGIRARGTEAAVESMTTNAIPSIECLPTARTTLRRVDRAIQRLSRRAALGADTTAERAALREARDGFAEQWSRCAAVPEYDPERGFREQVETNLADMTDSTEKVIRSFESGDRNAGFDELVAHTEPAIDRIDTALRQSIDVNVRQLDHLSDQIAQLRTSSRTTRAVLVALSAVLASIAAAVLVRVLQRFAGLMESRVSEMEHFAGRVAHDIRSPLAAVSLAIELAQRDPAASIRTGALDRASRMLRLTSQLVDWLLVFARAGAPPSGASHADVGEVLDGVIEILRPAAEENGVELTTDIPTAVSVACTPGVLISLTSNLIGNAIKYIGSSPVRRVHVMAHVLGDKVRFEVRDTGPGVPAEQRDHLFDPYIRGAASTVPGIGLGLATVRRLAEAHGGSIGFFPNAEAGSVFWFELPKVTGRRVGARAREPMLSRVGLRPSARG